MIDKEIEDSKNKSDGEKLFWIFAVGFTFVFLCVKIMEVLGDKV